MYQQQHSHWQTDFTNLILNSKKMHRIKVDLLGTKLHTKRCLHFSAILILRTSFALANFIELLSIFSTPNFTPNAVYTSQVWRIYVNFAMLQTSLNWDLVDKKLHIKRRTHFSGLQISRMFFIPVNSTSANWSRSSQH